MRNGSDATQLTKNSKQHRGVHYFIYEKFGNMKLQCWYKNKEGNVIEEVKQGDEGLLLCQSLTSKDEEGGTWLIDNGCSNHISGNIHLFKHIENSQQQSIRLGDDN